MNAPYQIISPDIDAGSLRRKAAWQVMTAVAAVYFIAAKLGLTMAFVADQVTAVWPPTGIALAAVLLFGYRIWPGIALGAFLANAMTSATPAIAFGITVGNTLEAIAGAFLLRRVLPFDLSLERLSSVLGLVFFAAVVSTTVSATIGVSSLCLGGIQPWTAFGSLWRVWWLGDATGDLVMAPLILAWAAARWNLYPVGRGAEAGLLLVIVTIMTLFVFSGLFAQNGSAHPLVYFIFPLVIWAALRFGQLGAATVTFIASGIAIWETVNGLGPFAKGEVNDSLILLQLFMAVVAVTGLVLGAVIAESRRAERRAATQYAAARILAESHTHEEGILKLLEAVCRNLDWDLGLLWVSDHTEKELHLVQLWHVPERRAPIFEAESWSRRFPPGIGLPGRVWATAMPLWLANVVDDTNFPRVTAAAREGLRSAFGIPIMVGEKARGVIEFFSRDIRPPDADLLEAMVALGHQVGQFIERARAEDASVASETRKAAIMENALDSIITIDKDSRVVEWNPAAEQTFGYSRGEAIGQRLSELIIPEHLRELHYLGMERYLTTGEGTLLGRRVEVTGMRKDGLEFPVELAISVFHWGNQPLFTAYVRDITEKKRAEDELRNAARRKDEFLAMLAHELRNPLSAISNAARVWKLGASDQHEWGREVIDRQVKHLARLVDDLLDVSRITRGKIQLKKEILELSPILKSALESVQPLLKERNHQLTITTEPEAIYVDGDAMRIEQIVTNLLTNAAKYTEPNGRIELNAAREGANVALSVRDTGVGIPTELLPHMFELFSQGDHSLDRSEGGLGIGLTLVRSLAEMHGGNVIARSEGLGKGSEFIVRLPAAEAPVKQIAEHRSEIPQEPEHSSRILVVDDNVDNALGMATLLTLLGHNVKTAFNGLSALEVARELRPEFMFLDIGLPGIDGYEVAARLRQEDFSQGLVIVAVSGYGQDEDRRRSHDAGFDYHLVKPVDEKDLLAILSK